MAVHVINRAVRTPTSKYVDGTKVRHIATVVGERKLPSSAERSAWLAANPEAWRGVAPVQVGRVLFFEEVTSAAFERRVVERAQVAARSMVA